MKNIFKALRKDHDKQRMLLNNLIKTSGDTPVRRELFKDIKTELKEHAKFEERVFYKPLLEHDITQEKCRHSIAEHHDIDSKIEEMEKTEFSSTGWLTLAKSLKDLVEHHLEEEEQEVFQLAGKALSESQKESLATKYENSMSEARC